MYAGKSRLRDHVSGASMSGLPSCAARSARACAKSRRTCAVGDKEGQPAPPRDESLRQRISASPAPPISGITAPTSVASSISQRRRCSASVRVRAERNAGEAQKLVGFRRAGKAFDEARLARRLSQEQQGATYCYGWSRAALSANTIRARIPTRCGVRRRVRTFCATCSPSMFSMSRKTASGSSPPMSAAASE